MSDLIDRQAVIEALYDGAYLSLEKRHALVDMIDRMPALKKKGKWIRETGQYYQILRCDQCGYVTVEQVRNYCPNCGTKMEENE